MDGKFPPTVKYIWGTMFGTDIVPCTIKEKTSVGQYLIEFFDKVAEENVERMVGKNELIFPNFASIII